MTRLQEIYLAPHNKIADSVVLCCLHVHLVYALYSVVIPNGYFVIKKNYSLTKLEILMLWYWQRWARKLRLFLTRNTNLNLIITIRRDVQRVVSQKFRNGRSLLQPSTRTKFRDGRNIRVIHSYGGYGGVSVLVAIAFALSVVGNFK